ncbi:MAG: nuclear transport factor 2 family protein [Alphaproteobacteria bacterium]|nr:nuclear transport factor 2 family protein [Alphaproteobacteria bacterium]
MTEPVHVDEALMKEIHDAFNARDVARIVALFAEDGVFATARGPHAYGERHVGRKAIAEFLAARFRSIPDMAWQHEYRYFCGDRAVSYWTVTGKDARGETLELKGCDLYTFENRKIKYKDTFWKQRT